MLMPPEDTLFVPGSPPVPLLGGAPVQALLAGGVSRGGFIPVQG